jgi:hypothetical protein
MQNPTLSRTSTIVETMGHHVHDSILHTITYQLQDFKNKEPKN